MPNFTLEDLDRYVNYAETGTAAASLGLTAATLVAPNPYTATLAVGTNIASAGIDLYQGIRSAVRGEWGNTAKNAGELILSLIGAKSIGSANKLMKMDKALTAANAPRQYVTKTIGRGSGRHTIRQPLERSMANERHGLGFALSIGSNASSFAGDVESNTKQQQQRNKHFDNTNNSINNSIYIPERYSIGYIAPQDNTRIVKPIIVKNKKK